MDKPQPEPEVQYVGVTSDKPTVQELLQGGGPITTNATRKELLKKVRK